MITNKDIEKLKTIFVTKEDLAIFKNSIVKEITDIVTIFANKFDESIAEIKAIKIISNDHEKRLQHVEKRKMN